MSNNDLDQWISENSVLYDNLTTTVISVVTNILRDRNIDYLNISGRTKSASSIKQKVDRKSYLNPKSDLTDISGVRIITFFESQAKQLNELMRRTFEVDEYNSNDKSSSLGFDRIGYRSIHLVCKLGDDRVILQEYNKFTGLSFEIQIRTVLQHAWAELSHGKSYKFGKNLPIAIQRKLNLYAGTLELVDLGFDEISQDIDAYSVEVGHKNDVDLLAEPINSITLSKFIEYVNEKFSLNIDISSDLFLGSSSVQTEIEQFGWKDISAIQLALTPEVVAAFKNMKERTNTVGFLRYLMMSSNMTDYFNKTDFDWRMIREGAYHQLVGKYGKKLVDKTLDRFDIVLQSDVEE